MADVLLRNLHDSMLRRLKATARASHRSLQGELHAALEPHSGSMTRAETRAAADQWRHRLRGRELGDSTADIRADRERE